LKLARYSAELEDAHERCLWGLGNGCYGGEASSDKRRWEMASATQLNFLELKHRDGEALSRSLFFKNQQPSEDVKDALESDENINPSVNNKTALPAIGSTDDEEFVINRLGQDSGVHACSNDVVVILSVAKETSSAIVLTRPNGTSFGLEGSTMVSLKILPGVSAKVPMILPWLDRATEICKQVFAITKLNWRADFSSTEGDSVGFSGGSMIPINRRVRQGSLEIPSVCLKNIVDENPVFLSRICSAPCQISLKSTSISGSETITKVEKGVPLDLIVDVKIASWLSKNLLDQTNLALEFCCVRNTHSYQCLLNISPL
jgi:hypothetical protein